MSYYLSVCKFVFIKILLLSYCFQQGEDKNDVEGDLEIQNLIGAFVVLVVGLVLALFITAAEFMNEVQNIVVREKVCIVLID